MGCDQRIGIEIWYVSVEADVSGIIIDYSKRVFLAPAKLYLHLFIDIHPLALEDVLHERRQSARSKSDYYVKHLFIRILRHTLGCDEDDEAFELPNAAPAITRLPRSSSPDPMYGGLSELEDSDDEGSRSPKKSNASWSENITLAGSGTVGKKPVGSMRKAQAYIMNDLERGRDDIVKRSKKKGSSFHTVSYSHKLYGPF